MRHAVKLEQAAVDRIRGGKQTRYTFNAVAGYKVGDLLDITPAISPLEGETPEELARRVDADRALPSAINETPGGTRFGATAPGHPTSPGHPTLSAASGPSVARESFPAETQADESARRTGTVPVSGRVLGERPEALEPGPAHDLVEGNTLREGLVHDPRNRDSRFAQGSVSTGRVAYSDDVVTVVIAGQREHTLNQTELADARAEGFETIEEYKLDWDAQRRNREAKRRSASNPRVYAVSFKLVVEGVVPNVQPLAAGTVEPTFPSETARRNAGFSAAPTEIPSERGATPRTRALGPETKKQRTARLAREAKGVHETKRQKAAREAREAKETAPPKRTTRKK